MSSNLPYHFPIMRCVTPLVVALVLSATPAQGQSLTCTLSTSESSRTCSRASLVLLNVPVLSTLSAPSTSYSLAPAEGTVPGSAYETGYFVPAQPLSLTLKTNAPANVYLRATGSTFTGTPTVCTTKSITSASVGSSATGTFSSLTTTSPGVLVHQQTTATAEASVRVHFRISLSWSADRPVTSACSLPLQLTLRTG